MSWQRTFITVVVSGIFSVFATSALDGGLPDLSVGTWAAFLGGLVAFALLAVGFERLRRGGTARY